LNDIGTCGNNSGGQLELAMNSDQYVDTTKENIRNFNKINTHVNNTMAIDLERSVLRYNGFDRNGQLGLGDNKIEMYSRKYQI